ncbi:DHH family phosphoesterase [Halosolutus gelatinilyticus]|uniref:DHH family phosphoesterase n=1 Tax=Halosolutus gelatinilyticus TaxID=2931975 RepID=UPI001FF4E8AF|nr:bifunctional oligoribonuclease/PAP phosphatase NrnA [Halosolutus gelatinilyticus]
MSRAAELASLLANADSLVIVCHDNPDPDCLASAIALETIADQQAVDDVTIAYGGEISHQQNRAFVRMLDIDLRELAETAVEEYDLLAFVDHSQPGANTELDGSIRPDIVVDHHPGPLIDAAYADVRSEYGATATIFIEYLDDLDVEWTTRLASALLFALHRERLDFLREPTRREYEAALAVYPYADLETLEQLYGSAFTPETIDAIGRAIASRERQNTSLVASVGTTTETDALPQAADYLLNLEGVDTVLAYGVVDGAIRLSARSIDPNVHIGETLRDGYDELGSVGGHHDMAGGRLELDRVADFGDDDDLLETLDDRLPRRFFDAIHDGE